LCLFLMRFVGKNAKAFLVVNFVKIFKFCADLYQSVLNMKNIKQRIQTQSFIDSQWVQI
jgi:hypothetical protein